MRVCVYMAHTANDCYICFILANILKLRRHSELSAPVLNFGGDATTRKKNAFAFEARPRRDRHTDTHHPFSRLCGAHVVRERSHSADAISYSNRLIFNARNPETGSIFEITSARSAAALGASLSSDRTKQAETPPSIESSASVRPIKHTYHVELAGQ